MGNQFKLIVRSLIMPFIATVSSLRAEVIYVDAGSTGSKTGQSWTDAFTDLQAALGSAGSGDEIWVAQGTYRPGLPGNRFATFQLSSGVALYGGFSGSEDELIERNWVANETFLSGDLLADDGPDFTFYSDNSFQVITASGADATSILDGFTVRGGNANGDSPLNYGGALYGSGGSPTLANCRFLENTAASGGAMYLIYDSSPQIVNCVFENNRSTSSIGVLYCRFDSSPLLLNCQFVNNVATSSWGVVSPYGSSPSFINCRFVGNKALDGVGGVFGAIENSGQTYHVDFVNCEFIGNSASSDGGVFDLYGWYGSDLRLTNCTFIGNSSGHWGGVISACSGEYAVVPVFSNCTFVGNVAAGSLGAVLFSDGWSGYTEFSNCIMWQNYLGGETADDVQTLYSAFDIGINYSCIQDWSGAFGGEGNISDDPTFIDMDGVDNVLGNEDDDVRIALASSCADSGSNSRVALDDFDLDNDRITLERMPVDLDGAPRFVDDRFARNVGEGISPLVDMGAYEARESSYFLIDSYLVAVPEGGTSGFAVALPDDPGVPLEVTITSDGADPDITIIDGVLLFDSANYSIPQTVSVSAAEDDDYLNGSEIITIEAAGALPAMVKALEVENDPAPPVVYVNGSATGLGTGESWVNAFTELRDALAVVEDVTGIEEVWVAEGTYLPAPSDGSRFDAFLLPSGLEIYGGFQGTETDREQRDPGIHLSILSGDLNGDDGPDFENYEDNSVHILRTDGVDSTTVIDGFIVTGGNADLAGNDSIGAGLLNLDGGSPVIRNCQFIGNSATGSGGGVFNGIGSAPLISDCRFVGNYAGHGSAIVHWYSFSILERCWFEANYTPGSGTAYNDYEDVLYESCTFFNNEVGGSGGGTFGWQSSTTLVNCQFIGNVAQGSGGASHKSDGESDHYVNCLFSGNTSMSNGGGIAISAADSTVTLTQCTLAGNFAQGAGGGIFADDEDSGSGWLHVTNSILWNNEDVDGLDESAQIDADPLVVNHTCIMGLTGKLGGAGNIGADPQLSEAEGADRVPGTLDDDLTLGTGSPAIDAGDNFAVPADIADLDVDGDLIEQLPIDLAGALRFVDDPESPDSGQGSEPIVDLGAYEFAPCEGDVNLDGTVDPLDSGYIIARFYCSVGMGDTECDRADANGDTIVDPLDAGFVLARFGKCP